MDNCTFVLMSRTGKYAVTCHEGGGFAHDNSDGIRDVDELNHASIFDNTSKYSKAYKLAIQEGYVEVPAYSVRKVYLGICDG